MGDRRAPAALWVLLAAFPALGQAPEPAGPAPAALEGAPSAEASADSAADGEDDGSLAESGAGEGEQEEEREAKPPLWMETYTEGVYSRHENENASGFTDVKMGKRFDLGRPFDVYAKARMHRDQRDFFWNNHLDAGAGARVNLLRGAALHLFAEVLGGYYYRTDAALGSLGGIQSRIDRNRAAVDALYDRFTPVTLDIFRRATLGETDFTQKELDSLDRSLTAHGTSLTALNSYLDSLETTRDSLLQVGDSLALIPAGPLLEYRGGFVFWYGRGQEPGPGGGIAGLPFRFWCDLYAEGIYISLNRRVQTRGGGDTYRDSVARFSNFILYANPDVGLILLDGLGGTLAAYGTIYAWVDTHGDWWNNRAMAGPGLRHKPLKNLDMVLAVEYLFGAYYGRERGDDPNPYDRSFQDVRLMANFWYGLGF